MQSVTDKEKLRVLIKEKKLSEETKREIDLKILNRFFSLGEWENKKVFVYVAVGMEVQTEGIINGLIKQKNEVYVPLCHGKGEMEAKRIFSLSDLKPGKYNIPEPPLDAATCPPEELQLIIVPGLAFGEDLSRLGRGAGYYDRFLKRAKEATKIALCREENIFRKVPCEEHDVFVDMIVTEKRLIEEKRGM